MEDRVMERKEGREGKKLEMDDRNGKDRYTLSLTLTIESCTNTEGKDN